MSLINLINSLRKLHAFLCPEFVKCNVVKRPARNLKPKPHRWAKYSLWVPSAKYGKQICSKLWFLCTLYNCTILYMLESPLPNYHTKMTVLAIWVSSREEEASWKGFGQPLDKRRQFRGTAQSATNHLKSCRCNQLWSVWSGNLHFFMAWSEI